MHMSDPKPASTAPGQAARGRRIFVLPASIFMALAAAGCATDTDRQSAGAGGDIGQLMAAEIRAIERETAGLFGVAPEPQKARRTPAARTSRSASQDTRPPSRRAAAKAREQRSADAALPPPATQSAKADTAFTDQQQPVPPAEQAAVEPPAAPSIPDSKPPPQTAAPAPVTESPPVDPPAAARSAPSSAPVTLNAAVNEQTVAPPAAPAVKAPSKTLVDSRKLLDEGKVLAARDVLMAGWEMNDPEVTLQLARTFDSYYLAQLSSTDSEADPVMARALYAKAVLLGSKKAKVDLERLINR